MIEPSPVPSPHGRCGPLTPLDRFAGTVILRTSTSAYLAEAGVVRAVVHAVSEPSTPASIRVDDRWWADERFLAFDAMVAIEDTVLRSGRHRIVLDVAPVRTTPRAPSARRPALPPGDVLGGAGHRADGLDGRVGAVLGALDGPDGLGAALDRLVGFGRGLTPAGDDALVGLLAVLWRGGEPSAAAQLHRLSEAVDVRLGRTSIFGRFHLGHALAGQFGAAVAAVLDALEDDAVDDRGGPSPALAAATVQLLRLGATSGADTLLGMAAALRWRGRAAGDAPARGARPMVVGGVR